MLRMVIGVGFSFLFSWAVSSQIVNVEKRRTKNLEKGMQGDIDVGVNFVHTNTDMTQVASRIKLQYNDHENTYLLSSDLGYSQIDKKQNVDNGNIMLKYNYWVPEKIIIAEAFCQYSYNRVKQLKHRYVIGGGPRFNVADNEKFSLFLVAYTIYLNELFETKTYERTKSLVKFSSMLAFDWKISPSATFGHTTYYEPDYSNPSDYRVWSETKLEFKISKKFTFGVFARFDYDNQVPPGVDPLFYTVNNSFKLKF